MQTIKQKSEARIAIEPDFVWDDQDAYLFDIDGTLLSSCDSVHWDSFEASIRRMTGFEVTLTGIPVAGSTDTAILRAACQRAGVPVEIVDKQIDAILESMCSSVTARQHEMRVALM
ncbi:MAG: hypothetical protein WBP85_05530, partial [Terracidiphilus sp.]